MQREMHRSDRMYLIGFGADLTSPKLLAKYTDLQGRWLRANNKGELPQGVLLMLAQEFPKPAQVEEKPVIETATKKPKKELQPA